MMLPLLKILLEFSRTPFLEWSSSCHVGAAHFFRERDSNDHVSFLFPLSTWAVADTTWQPVIKENWICILSKLREHSGFIYKYQILKTLKIWKVALVLSKIVFGGTLHQLIGTEGFHICISSNPTSSPFPSGETGPSDIAGSDGQKRWLGTIPMEENLTISKLQNYPFDPAILPLEIDATNALAFICIRLHTKT